MATIATTMTGAQFDALPYDEGRQWELINGELIPMPSPTLEHQSILREILVAFTLHLRSHPEQGIAHTDVEFACAEDYRVRPDVFVLSAERAAQIDPHRVPVPGAPDLAVEIISPSERATDTQKKLQAYPRYGTREIWQIYSPLRTVVVHRSGSSITLGADQILTTPLLPEFSLPLHSLFVES